MSVAQAASYPKPLPELNSLTKPFWDGAKNHELVLQRCKNCGELQFYPRAWCIHCGKRELEWIKASGTGTVYSFVVIRQVVGNAPAFQEEIPFVLAEVDLDEGPRVYGRLAVKPEDAKVGMKVAVAFDDVTPEISLPKFRPA